MLSRKAFWESAPSWACCWSPGWGWRAVVLLAAKEPERKPAAKISPSQGTGAHGKRSGAAQACRAGAAAADATVRGGRPIGGHRGAARLAEKAFRETFEYYEADDALPTEVYRWSMVWLHYELELATDAGSGGGDSRSSGADDESGERRPMGARGLEFYVAEAEWMFDRRSPIRPLPPRSPPARSSRTGDVESIEEEGMKQTRPDIKLITSSAAGRFSSIGWHRQGRLGGRSLEGAGLDRHPGDKRGFSFRRPRHL